MKNLVSGPQDSTSDSCSPEGSFCLPVPNHVAIIMDGNGRWAEGRGKLRPEGHRAGTQNLRSVARAFSKYGVNYLTLFAFSTENWERPEDEVQNLLDVLGEVMKYEIDDLHRENVKIRHMGRLDRLSAQLQQSILDSIRLTQNNSGITIVGAFDYGGRDDILNAVRQIVSDGISPNRITEEIIGRYLYTADIPDPDLVIRTAGEMRLSNFLLWQSAYSEYYSTPVFWPDFDEIEVDKAMKAYSQRQRRFGKLPTEDSKFANHISN